MNGLEQGYVEDLVNAKQIPDLMLGTFGSSARKAMQGLPRLTLQNVRNYERPPCAKRGLGILNYRLVQDWKRVRVDPRLRDPGGALRRRRIYASPDGRQEADDLLGHA